MAYSCPSHGDSCCDYQLANNSTLLQVACGNDHSVALTDHGFVLTWGRGFGGALGHNDEQDRAKPKLVEALVPPRPHTHTHTHTLTCDGG